MPFSCHLCPKRFNRSYTLVCHLYHFHFHIISCPSKIMISNKNLTGWIRCNIQGQHMNDCSCEQIFLVLSIQSSHQVVVIHTSFTKEKRNYNLHNQFFMIFFFSNLEESYETALLFWESNSRQIPGTGWTKFSNIYWKNVILHLVYNQPTIKE